MVLFFLLVDEPRRNADLSLVDSLISIRFAFRIECLAFLGLVVLAHQDSVVEN